MALVFGIYKSDGNTKMTLFTDKARWTPIEIELSVPFLVISMGPILHCDDEMYIIFIYVCFVR